MNKKNLKQYLFELYSKNLEMVLTKEFPNIEIKEPLYVCPLCKRYFNSKSLSNNAKNNLTIEHIPPESVGGKDLILTCKQCNNIHGSKYDSHLDKKLKQRKFFNFEAGEFISTSFELNDSIKSDGLIKIGENKRLNFVFQESRTNPKYHEKLKQIVQGDFKSGRIKFRFKTHNNQRSNISILRSGFLYAFKILGYGFLLSRNSEIPRKIIMDYEFNKNSFNSILTGEIPDEMLGINIIKKPVELNSYCIVIKINEGTYNKNYGVILPGANKECETIYQDFDVLTSKNPNLSITFEHTPNIDYIKSSKFCRNPYYNWIKKENGH